MKYRLKQVKRFARMVSELRRERFDVLMPFMTEPSIVVSSAARLMGGRDARPVCIWNERSSGGQSFPPVVRRLERLTARFATAFIANSAAGAAYLVNEVGAAASNVRVIDNGVALAPALRSREQWRSTLGAGEHNVVVTMVGNLHRPKDQATLIRAWRLLQERLGEGRRDRLILALAGRFVETHDELQSMAADLGVSGLVRFLGPVDDIAGLLGATDIGVFSSTYEGTPNGVIECMAAGLPVVSTDVGDVREAVERPYLLTVGDERGFADLIADLSADPARCRKIGERNRRLATEKYGAPRMAREFASAIAEIVANRRQR